MWVTPILSRPCKLDPPTNMSAHVLAWFNQYFIYNLTSILQYKNIMVHYLTVSIAYIISHLLLQIGS